MDNHYMLHKEANMNFTYLSLVPETGVLLLVFASRVWTTNGVLRYLNVSVYTARPAFLYEL